MFGQFFELWPLPPGPCDAAGGAVGVVGVVPDVAALAIAAPPAASAAVAATAIAPFLMPCLVMLLTSFRSCPVSELRARKRRVRVLAARTLIRSGVARTLTLRPSPRVARNGRRFTAQVRVVAYDAAGQPQREDDLVHGSVVVGPLAGDYISARGAPRA